MCNEAVSIEPRLLVFVPDRFKTQEMRNETVRIWLSPSVIPGKHLSGSLNALKYKRCVKKLLRWDRPEDEKNCGSNRQLF